MPKDFKNIILRDFDSNDIIDEMISLRKCSVINNNGVNNGVNNGNIINITINAYDRPDTDYITTKDANKCLKNLETALLEMAKKVYFNPVHPENHSIY